MLDKFTEPAKSLVADARGVAESMRHKEISNEHLLKAIIQQPNCLAYRFVVFTNTPWMIIDEGIDTMLSVASGDPVKISGFADGFKKAVEIAITRSEEYGLNWISTGSLMLGIVESGTSSASRILTSWGLSSDYLTEQLKAAGNIGQDEKLDQLPQTELDLIESSKCGSEDLIKLLTHAQDLSRTYSNPEVNFYHILLSFVFLSQREVIRTLPLDPARFNLEATKSLVADKLATNEKSSEKSIVYSRDAVHALSIASLESFYHGPQAIGLLDFALGMLVVNPQEVQTALKIDYKHLRRLMAGQRLPVPNESPPPARKSMAVSGSIAIPQISLRRYNTDKGAVINIPQKLAEEWGVLALNVSQSTMTVAMVDPTNTEVIRKLRELTGLEIAVIRTEERDLRAAFKMNY